MYIPLIEDGPGKLTVAYIFPVSSFGWRVFSGVGYRKKVWLQFVYTLSLPSFQTMPRWSRG